MLECNKYYINFFSPSTGGVEIVNTLYISSSRPLLLRITVMVMVVAAAAVVRKARGGGEGAFVGKKVEKLFCTSRARKSFDKWRWLHWR